MTDLSKIPPGLRPALQIFIGELKAHVNHFATLGDFQAALQGGVDSSGLQHRFHTIKGGAGFFNLERIREEAGRAEKLLQARIMPSEVSTAAAVLRGISDVLSQELAALEAAVAADAS